ncbi:MAG: transposase [Cytophagaceae bacterium]|nr:MAG: transposase [Cytophagaceae bacterium]
MRRRIMGSIMGRKRRAFTEEFKAEVVRLVHSGRKTAELCREMELTPSSVAAWIRQAKVDAGDGQGGELSTVERRELATLRKKLREVEMERDILKKATVWFAKHAP